MSEASFIWVYPREKNPIKKQIRRVKHEWAFFCLQKKTEEALMDYLRAREKESHKVLIVDGEAAIEVYKKEYLGSPIQKLITYTGMDGGAIKATSVHFPDGPVKCLFYAGMSQEKAMKRLREWRKMTREKLKEFEGEENEA